MDLQTFVAKWQQSRAEERSNKDGFLYDLADILGVPRPEPKTGDPERDRYVFEHDVPTLLEDGKVSTRKVDLYKHGSFILEAKQGSEAGDKKPGFARRGTDTWDLKMQETLGQALGYAGSMDDPPPFIVICDIGHCFDLYASFDRTPHRAFPNALRKRIWFKDLLTEPAHLETLRKIWLDPLDLDPSRHAAKVTREVAASIADLARSLEDQGHPSEVVAKFLMRCLFTMFAEDVGLLPERSFTKMIKDNWLPNPPSFHGPGGVSALWRTMNKGGSIPLLGDILRFNGGLFADTSAVPLKKGDLKLLLAAAERDWADVEPAIFGTLLERALNKRERHMLGAHFTPRAYVERLVRPTIEEPLREEWVVVQAEARRLRLEKKGVKARALVHAFLRKLCGLRVLDPACGSGNFLYVALDLFKRIETEVLELLRELGERQEKLLIEGERVTPKQFLGIEVKPWAKEIADLVLWIGFLQWHYRSHKKGLPPPEPVLLEYNNIECRDAVLAWDDIELLRDDTGKPVSRWDGETYKKSAVTGEDVPDEAARAPVYVYLQPKKAAWPKADFVVGNPPFIGSKRLRIDLGDGYVEALRSTYRELPESIDLVMYWWDRAATLVGEGAIQRSGLITTTSVTQTFNRRIIERHVVGDPPVSLVFATSDHPWGQSKYGQTKGTAEVRIAMTVLAAGRLPGTVATVIREVTVGDGEVRADLALKQGTINSDLTVGADVTRATALVANRKLASRGVQLFGAGFIVPTGELPSLGRRDAEFDEHVRPYLNGQDIAGATRGHHVIDLLGLSEEEVLHKFPELYQRLAERVKPERDQNNRESYRKKWWLFGEPRRDLRPALRGLRRYIATPASARRRYFIFVDGGVLPDDAVIAIPLEDAFFLGILSSRVHVAWALAAGGRLGVRNDPRYNNSKCFDPFPFPACGAAVAQNIRNIAERLDAHRKRQQQLFPGLTLTKTYKVLGMVQREESLDANDKVVHERALVSVLKKLHDELDAAVFAAYGWPRDLADDVVLQKLVDLNAERAEEERGGQIRWLRPEYQNPASAQERAQGALPTPDEAGDEVGPNVPGRDATSWPKKPAEKIALVRDCVTASRRALSLEQVAAAFLRAPRREVEDMLDSLTAVGVLTELDTDGGKRWKATARVG
jgi:hypothetical protein